MLANSVSQSSGETELLNLLPKILSFSSLKGVRSFPPLPHLPPLCWSPKRAEPSSVFVPGSLLPEVSWNWLLPCCCELLCLKPFILSVSTSVKHSFANTFPTCQTQQRQCSQQQLLVGGVVWCPPWLQAGLRQPVQSCFAAMKPSSDAAFPCSAPSFLWRFSGLPTQAALTDLLPPCSLSTCCGTVLFWCILFHRCQKHLKSLKVSLKYLRIRKAGTKWKRRKMQFDLNSANRYHIMLCT